MATTKELQARINSTKKTKKITNAMQLVSSSKMSKAERNAKNYVPYSKKIQEVVANIAGSNPDISHPMLTKREVKKTAYLIITSDKGLVGGYNNHLLKALEETIKNNHQSSDEYTTIVLGKKGYDYCKKQNIPIAKSSFGLPDHPIFADVKKLAYEAIQMYADQEVDEIYLIYNHYINAVSQQVTTNKLLPLTDLQDQENSTSVEYEYEPDQESILETLLPQYAESLIFGALLDAKASEHAASMTAMKNATDNANDLIDDFSLQYNRLRQAAITQEINEISGAVAALE